MNHFDYFSEIEERFTARRGSLLLLSTLDWALIETWREAGVPLAAVLRGIDDAFDRYEQRRARAKGRLQKVNGLAWCAQAVMQAATEMAEAATGFHPRTAATEPSSTGFEAERITRYLEANALVLRRSADNSSPAFTDPIVKSSTRLQELAAESRAGAHPALDELDRTLTVLEEQLLAAITAATPEPELLALRETADRELTPYRARLNAVQARQIRDQFVHKRLFETHGLPRLSLFYMPVEVSAPGPETSSDRDGNSGEAAA